jgi:hypothetical protein
MQPREHETVPSVRLHSIPAPLRDHRRTHGDAVLAALDQVPIDPEAAGAGFVDEVEVPVRCAQGTHDPIERLKVARDYAVMADLPWRLPSAIETSIVSLWTSNPTNMLRFPMTDRLACGAVRR